MDLKGSLGEEEEFGGVWQSRQWELGGGGGERTCSKWEWFLKSQESLVTAVVHLSGKSGAT